MNNSSTDQTNHYWGLWATLALGAVVFLVFSVCQAIALFAYIYNVDPQAVASLSNSDSVVTTEQLLSRYMLNGDAIAMAEIPAAIIGVALVLWFSSMRKPLTIDEYLKLNIPQIKILLQFVGVMIAILVTMEIVNYVLQRPTPDFMIEVYSNTQNFPLLWIAVIVAAPFFEEFLFRGFLFEGLIRSRLGMTGTIFLTSAAWAVIHMQYEWFEIFTIFIIGIALCISKIRSQSLYVPIALHMVMNLVASVGMHLSK